MVVNDSIQYKAVYQTGGINLYPNNLDPEVSSFTSLVDFDWGGLPYNIAFSFPDGSTSGNHLFDAPAFSSWHTFSIYVKMDDGSEPVTASDDGTPDFQVTINGVSNYSNVLKTHVGDNIWRIIVTKDTGLAGQSGIRRTYGQVSGKGFKVIGVQLNPGQTPDEPTPTYGTPVTEKKVKPFTIINGNTVYGKKRILYDTGAIFAKARDKNFEVPEVKEKLLINEFIRQETRAGIWDRNDLYMHFAYNTPELTQFARINWRNPFGKGTVYNLCTYSTDWSQAVYNSGGAIKTPNTVDTAAPDGTYTACKFDDTGASDNPGVTSRSLTVGSNSTTLTASIYIKAGTAVTRVIRLRDDTTSTIKATVTVNLVDGTYSFSGGSPVVVNVGNGWYRVSITATDCVVGNIYRLYYGRVGSASIGDTDTWYLWGMQVENNSYATDYIPTGAEPVAGDNLALLYGGLVHTAYGFEGNGIDGYIDTQFNPAIMGKNYTLNDASRTAILYKAGVGAANVFHIIDGIPSSDITNTLYEANLNQHRINQGSNTLANSVDLSGTGMKSINRNNSATVRLINKDIENSVAADSTVLVGERQLLLKRPSGYSNVGLSSYGMGGSFTYEQTQAHRGNVNNLLKGFGLNEIA